MSIPRLAHRETGRLATAFFACFLVLPALLSAADDKPAPKESDGTVGPVRHQALKAFTYFYKSTDTDFDGIKEVVEKVIPELHKAIADGKIDVRGPVVFIYHGATVEPKVKFKLEIGMPVAEGAQPAGDFKVRGRPRVPLRQRALHWTAGGHQQGF